MVVLDEAVAECAARLADASRDGGRVVRDDAVLDNPIPKIDAAAVARVVVVEVADIPVDDATGRTCRRAVHVDAAAMVFPRPVAANHAVRDCPAFKIDAGAWRVLIVVAAVVGDEAVARLTARHVERRRAVVRERVRNRAVLDETLLEVEAESLRRLPAVAPEVAQRQSLEYGEVIVKVDALAERLDGRAARIVGASEAGVLRAVFGHHLDGLVDGEEAGGLVDVDAVANEDRRVVRRGGDGRVERGVVARAVRRDDELGAEEGRDGFGGGGREGDGGLGGVGIADVARPAEEGVALGGGRCERHGVAGRIYERAGDCPAGAGRHLGALRPLPFEAAVGGGRRVGVGEGALRAGIDDFAFAVVELPARAGIDGGTGFIRPHRAGDGELGVGGEAGVLAVGRCRRSNGVGRAGDVENPVRGISASVGEVVRDGDRLVFGRRPVGAVRDAADAELVGIADRRHQV